MPTGHRALGNDSSLPLETALAALKPVLEDDRVAKIGHDLKFDMIMLARHGVALRGLDTDTMIGSYLIDATRSAHALEDLALEHTSYKALTEEDVCGRGAKARVAGGRAGRGGASTTRASAPTSPDSSRRFCEDRLEQGTAGRCLHDRSSCR